jgi:predicted regulator of amino acid metabolism with ACT domain
MHKFIYHCTFLSIYRIDKKGKSEGNIRTIQHERVEGFFMWEEVERHFDKFPAQAKVARMLLRAGLRVSGTVKRPKIYCGDIELSDTAIGRAAGVDRRVVRDTTKTIFKKKKLKEIFAKLLPTCNLKDVANTMGWSVIELIPSKADTPGIIAKVTAIFSDRSINIRQVVIEDDPAHSEHPRGFIITERAIPADIITKVREVQGVDGVTIH